MGHIPMGANLTLKNIPTALMEQLRTRAKSNHRSLQGEILAILENGLRPRMVTVEGLYSWVKEAGLSTPDEAVAMVREDRDER